MALGLVNLVSILEFCIQWGDGTDLFISVSATKLPAGSFGAVSIDLKHLPYLRHSVYRSYLINSLSIFINQNLGWRASRNNFETKIGIYEH